MSPDKTSKHQRLRALMRWENRTDVAHPKTERLDMAHVKSLCQQANIAIPRHFEHPLVLFAAQVKALAVLRGKVPHRASAQFKHNVTMTSTRASPPAVDLKKRAAADDIE